MAKKNQRNLQTVNAVVNNTQKEEKNMKNTKIDFTGASVTLTKVGVGTISFTQPKEHGDVIYTVFGVDTKISMSEAIDKIAQFQKKGWKTGQIVEHKVASENYIKTYAENLAEINSKKKDKKSASIEKPMTKPTTTDKDLDKIKRKNQLWNEMKATIYAEVKKSGRYFTKDAWKKEMYDRLEKNDEWVAIVGLRSDKKNA